MSCATCHLPRAQHQRAGVTTIRVQHNQNDGLRPNEAMVRPVCQNCHGLGFALDALADPELIRRNFPHAPTHHVESIDMAVRRAEADRARRGADSARSDQPSARQQRRPGEIGARSIHRPDPESITGAFA